MTKKTAKNDHPDHTECVYCDVMALTAGNEISPDTCVT